MSKARSHDLCPLPFGMRSRTPFPLGVLQRRRSSWEGGRHGSPINFNTSFWSIFNQATSQCSPSTFQIHSHPILHHRYLELKALQLRKGSSQLTFSNAATQIPHIKNPSGCRHLGIGYRGKWQIHQQQNQQNQQNLHVMNAPIEKRILQRLEALDPSSHWRHARSASLLDFAAAKPSSNLLVVHVPGQSLAHKRNLLQQRREGRHFKHTKLCLSCCGHHSTQVPSLPLISFSDSVIKVKSALKNFGPSKIQWIQPDFNPLQPCYSDAHDHDTRPWR